MKETLTAKIHYTSQQVLKTIHCIPIMKTILFIKRCYLSCKAIWRTKFHLKAIIYNRQNTYLIHLHEKAESGNV